MKHPRLLISGPHLATNLELIYMLRQSATVLINDDDSKIERIIAAQNIDALLLEISRNAPSGLEMISNLRRRYPSLVIAVVNNDKDGKAIVDAIQAGAADAFRKPLKNNVIAERVSALLHQEVLNKQGKRKDDRPSHKKRELAPSRRGNTPPRRRDPVRFHTELHQPPRSHSG